MKSCKSCGNSFPLENYSKSGKYYSASCKPCVAKRSREHYQRVKEDPEMLKKKRQDSKIRLREAKLKAIEYLGGKCVDCGYQGHPSVFDFHHLDPTVKEDNPSAVLRRKNWKEEIDKCVLLCANCHRLRHFGGRDDWTN